MRTGRHQDGGFVMVALLVSMSIAAIWMTAALPSWRQQVQRSREEETIWRGIQYARAIMLYQDKNQGALPPNLDILISQRYLRKKYKDPITDDEFAIVGIGMVTTGWTDQNKAKKFGCQTNFTSGAQIYQGAQTPGISGVRSKSCLTSIKVWQNQQAHNMWPFDGTVYRQLQNQWAPRNVPGPGGPGGQPGGQPGRGGDGRGQPGRGGDTLQPGRGGAAPPPGPGRGGRGPFPFFR